MSNSNYGLTAGMQETWGDYIFELSSNIQTRYGDPVRQLEFEKVEQHRPDTGMSDIEIAALLGLTEIQVRFIRMMEESRRFRINQYQKLYRLGGGKRYREERYLAAEDEYKLSEQGMALRKALKFDPGQVRGFIESGYWKGDTVAGWFTQCAKRAPDQVMVRQGDREISYAQGLRHSQHLAAWLQELGLIKGDPVAVQLPNSIEYLLVYLGLVISGMVLVPIHTVYRSGDMEPLLRHARVRAIVCESADNNYDAPATMLKMQEKLEDLELVIVSGEAPAGTHRLQDYGDIPPASSPEIAPVATDPLILGFTSGTSSSPKSVMITHQTALSALAQATPLLGFQSGDRILSAAPFTHMFGMMVIHWSLHATGTLILLPQFRPDRYIKLINTEKPQVVFTAPAHMATCLQENLLQNCDLDSVRTMIFSGAVCPPSIAQQVDELLPAGETHQMYGMTEAMVVSFTRPGDAKDIRYNSCGRVVTGQELRIASVDNGEILGAGEEGVIQVKGPSVLPGYYENESATLDAFTDDGWFITGDLGLIDGQGNLTISGRTRDLINRGGVKINPVDIEIIIGQHSKVTQTAIVAVPDERLGEKACCFVVCRPGCSIDLEEVQAHLQDHSISKQKWPELLVIVEEMPMTPSRKIIKNRLLADMS